MSKGIITRIRRPVGVEIGTTGRFSYKGKRLQMPARYERRTHSPGNCEQCKELVRRLYSYSSFPGLYCCKGCLIARQIDEAWMFRYRQENNVA